MAGKLFAKHIVRKIFLEDWGLKLTALVITLGLWFGVTGLSSPTTKRLTVPLNLNVSSSTQITNAPREEVDIEISGDKRTIDQISRSDLIATVDLTDRASGEQIVALSPETVFVSLPQGVKVIDVAPSRIAVRLEVVDEKEIEVKVVTKGAAAAGFEVYSTAAQPTSIRVRGPASVVRALEFVQTDVIDLSDRREGFTARQVAVNSPNPQAVVLNTFVDVAFRIGEKRIERDFTLAVPGVSGKTVSFAVYGPRTLLSKLRDDEIKIEMYLNDQGEETAQIALPNELRALAEVRKVQLLP